MEDYDYSPALRNRPLPNSTAKTPNRNSPSEYLDDILMACGNLRNAADKIEALTLKADADRRAGRGWEINPAKGQLDMIAVTLDRLRTLCREAHG